MLYFSRYYVALGILLSNKFVFGIWYDVDYQNNYDPYQKYYYQGIDPSSQNRNEYDYYYYYPQHGNDVYAPSQYQNNYNPYQKYNYEYIQPTNQNRDTNGYNYYYPQNQNNYANGLGYNNNNYNNYNNRGSNENFPFGLPYCNIQEYKQVKRLGNGVDGTVFKMKRQNQYYAYKVSVNTDFAKKNLIQEMRMMSRIKDSSIAPKIVCVGKDGASLMMEFLDAIPLAQVKTNNIDSMFKRIAGQMINIFNILHSKHILHLDGHLNNWMYQQSTGKVFIIDFGRAKDPRDPKTQAVVLMPECQNGQMNYSEKSDVWLTGLAWADWLLSNMKGSNVVGAGTGIQAILNHFGSSYRQMLTQMLATSPTSRPTFQQIQSIYLPQLKGISQRITY